MFAGINITTMSSLTTQFKPILVGLGLMTAVSSAMAQQEAATMLQKGSSTIEVSSEERSERMEFERKRIIDPALNEIPEGAYWQAVLQTKQMREFTQNQQEKVLTWTERGPNSDVVGASNGNTRANSGITAGRIRAVHPDLSDPTGKKVWIGGVDGGLWKTNDITASPATWTLVNDYFSNLAVTDICQDPSNTSIMYFCTGEAYYNADAVSGVGVFKSTDGGATWSQLNSTTSYTLCTRILCDNLGNVYLGTRGSGLKRSTNGGSTWTTITPTGTGSNVCDLEVSTTATAGRLHVVMGIFSTQYYRYVDNPSTATTTSWLAPTTGFPSYSNRAEIACVGSTLYACPVNASNVVPQIYKSTNGGQTWAATGGNPTSGWCNAGWYAVSVGIDPSNVNNCMVGGLELYGTTNGGTTWTKKANWVGTTGQYVHADIHDITWYNGGNTLLIGCDGGVHYSADKGTTIRDRNRGLRIKQFYSVALHPTTTNYMIGGTQDNGTHQLSTAGLGASVEVTGGDGGFVAIDNNQPQYQFATYTYNQYRRSTNSGSTWSSVNLSSTAGAFINPYDYDDSGNRLYAAYSAGSYLHWSNPQTGSTWNSVTVANFGGSMVSTVKVSPYTANRVYFGTEAGRIVSVSSANLTSPTSTIINASAGMPTSYVSCVNVGANDNELIACFSNYGVQNVWVSLNGGTTWTAVDGNLPNMPVRWCMFFPGNNDAAIIATETGVWETTNLNGASTVWVTSSGFPNVRVDMLDYRSSDGVLAAATHGRGIFTTTIGARSVNPMNLSSTAWSPSTVKLQWDASVNGSVNTISYQEEGTEEWITAGSTDKSFLFVENLAPATRYNWKLVTELDNGAVELVAQFETPEDAIPCPALAEIAANNSLESAAEMSTNDKVKGAFAKSGNSAFYSFTLTEEGFGTIALSNASAEMEVHVMNKDHQILATLRTEEDGTGTLVQHLPPGTYYLKVSATEQPLNEGCYQLAVAITPKSELLNGALQPMFEVESSVRIYPNPATNEFFLNTEDEINEWSEVVIMDVNGRVVHRQSLNSQSVRITLENVNAGTYIVATTTAHVSEINKLILR